MGAIGECFAEATERRVLSKRRARPVSPRVPHGEISRKAGSVESLYGTELANRDSAPTSAFARKSRPVMLNLSLSGHDPLLT
jgi:hypothetical protein